MELGQRTKKVGRALGLHKTGAGRLIARRKPRGQVQQNRLDIRDAIQNKRTVLDTPPLSLAVLLEGRGCNSKCIYCTHIALDGDDETFRPEYAPGKKSRSDVGYTFGTSQALIESVEAVAPKIGSFRFGGGEPTLYPEFWQVADMVKRNPHAVMSLCTNALALTDKMIREVILMPQFRYLVVSIDAATPETYRHIRGGSFEKVRSNISRVQELRTGKFPIVKFNYVVMRSNVHEIVPLVDLARDLGVAELNYILLIQPNVKAYPDSEALARRAENLRQEDADREQCIEILRLVEEAKSKAREYGIGYPLDRITPAICGRYPDLAGGEIDFACVDCDDDAFDGLEVQRSGSKLDVDWPSVFCHQPFANFSAGHYRTNFCCYARHEFMTGQYMAFSDDDATVMDLWNHPRIVKARDLMYQGRADVVCSDTCPHVAGGGLKVAGLS